MADLHPDGTCTSRTHGLWIEWPATVTTTMRSGYRSRDRRETIRRLAELRRRLAAAEDALPGWVRASRLAVQSLAIRLLHLSAVFGCRPSQRRRSATKSLAKSRAGNFNFRKFTKLDSFITEVRRDKASS